MKTGSLHAPVALTIASDRNPALTKESVERLPESLLLPPGARIVYSHATGMWEGCGFDGLDMSACLDRRLEGPLRFAEVLQWYRSRLSSLGWPPGSPVRASDGTRRHCWERGPERIDLIDRVISPDSPVARIPSGWRGQRLRSELPPGWWSWTVMYKRRPPGTNDAAAGEERRLWTPVEHE